MNSYGSAKVPLLEYGDDFLITESIDVCKYIAEHIAPSDEMYPAATAESITSTRQQQQPLSHRDLVDEFLYIWDNDVTSKYYNYLSATGKSSVKQTELAFQKSLIQLESLLSKVSNKGVKDENENEDEDDDGNFLLGNTFSIAECVAGPWVQRFQVVIPYFRGKDFFHDILQPTQDQDLPYLTRWIKAVSERESVQITGCPEQEMFAAAKRYYVSYVSPGAPAAAVL